MKILLDKLFCKHEWKSHVKETYNWSTTELVKGTEHYFHPKLDVIENSETVEVLICQKCGKIHKITY